ncbi:MAG: hypothetical protein Q7S59_02550 [Sulfurimonas sp.]|nr:hypothetical protein [Sulfurimonas sp.]
MLESSVWRQYNNENSFRDKLSEFCKIDVLDIITDDKELYAMLKSKLTKKELKLFAMDSAKRSDEEICTTFSMSMDELTQAKYKLYKKLKQDKTKLNFKESSFSEAKEYE